MRDSDRQSKFRPTTDKGNASSPAEVPFDGREFFESFYTANVDGPPRDHMTIGWITEAEAAFHYNAVENAIIRALLRRTRPPANSMVQLWRHTMKRKEPTLLDVGAGTGHWVDFMRDTFYVKECYAVEITSKMSDFLKEKYAAHADVHVLRADVSAPDFCQDALKGRVDYVTAIGVMFHIVEDDLWLRALALLPETRSRGTGSSLLRAS